MRRGHMYVPLISEPPKEYRAEVALIHALEIFRARMKMLTSFHIEGRVPYLRLSLDLYKRLHPEKKIAYGPPMVEIPLDDLISDDSKLEILENCGLLKIKNKQTENGLIQELHFRQSKHPMEPGLFYKPVGEAQRIMPAKSEIQEVIIDFTLKIVKIINNEARRILKEHGLDYDSLPDAPYKGR